MFLSFGLLMNLKSMTNAGADDAGVNDISIEEAASEIKLYMELTPGDWNGLIKSRFETVSNKRLIIQINNIIAIRNIQDYDFLISYVKILRETKLECKKQILESIILSLKRLISDELI